VGRTGLLEQFLKENKEIKIEMKRKAAGTDRVAHRKIGSKTFQYKLLT
jgi:hypothetical protein